MKKSCSQILTENNFFEAENFFAYQKKKNSSQALFPLIQQILDTISGKYGHSRNGKSSKSI